MTCQATAPPVAGLAAGDAGDGAAGARKGAGGQLAGLVLAPSVSAPGRARRHLARVLAGWELGVLADTAGLLVSELVTNAVQVSREVTAALPARPGGAPAPIALTVWRSGASLVIGVADLSPRAPVRGNAEPWEENGRGLVLVESLSSAWGYHATGQGGKIVWCELALPASRSAVGGHVPAHSPAPAGWEHGGEEPDPDGGARSS